MVDYLKIVNHRIAQKIRGGLECMGYVYVQSAGKILLFLFDQDNTLQYFFPPYVNLKIN